MNTVQVIAIVAAALVVLAVIVLLNRQRRPRGRPVPEQLRRGSPLPGFTAADEQGNPVHAKELHGTPAVLIFVRGSWCPFCNAQVENLTRHYKDIVDLGARLILVTPKPLETTRRVAEFFEVEFEFWLDADLAVAKQLGLVHEDAVPGDFRREYGANTVWPTALVIDSAGMIRYVRLSRSMADRPDAGELLKAVQAASAR